MLNPWQSIPARREVAPALPEFAFLGMTEYGATSGVSTVNGPAGVAGAFGLGAIFRTSSTANPTYDGGAGEGWTQEGGVLGTNRPRGLILTKPSLAGSDPLTTNNSTGYRIIAAYANVARIKAVSTVVQGTGTSLVLPAMDAHLTGREWVAILLGCYLQAGGVPVITGGSTSMQLRAGQIVGPYNGRGWLWDTGAPRSSFASRTITLADATDYVAVAIVLDHAA